MKKTKRKYTMICRMKKITPTFMWHVMESKINLFIQFFLPIFFSRFRSLFPRVVLTSTKFADQSPLLLQQHINHATSFFIFGFNILCMSAHTEYHTRTKPHCEWIECMRSVNTMKLLWGHFYITEQIIQDKMLPLQLTTIYMQHLPSYKSYCSTSIRP